ncbi:MAG: B12-binding domain-containing radical SAM protein [Planctomycetota bacterium]
MRILLINPPVRDFYNTPLRRQPLGLLYLASALREKGHEVGLLDSGASRQTLRIEWPDSMDEMIAPSDAFDSSPFKLFGRYYHFGPAFSEIEEQVRDFEPDVVGISSLFNAYAAEAMACAEAAQRGAPAAKRVLGGGYPTSAPAMALRNPAVDFVIRGEGEQSFTSLVENLARKESTDNLAGICGRKKDGSLFFNPPHSGSSIDSIHPPARDLLDADAYRIEGRRLALILSSRGCPFQCAFCSAYLTSGRGFRARAPEAVVKEMKQSCDEFGIEAFDFEDDNLTLDPERAGRLMQLIIETFGRDRLWLGTLNGISANGMTPELLSLMREAGFRSLNLSPLSGHSAMREAMCRPGSYQEIIDTAHRAAAIGFQVTATLMVGFPGQSLPEMMDHVMKWAAEPVLLVPSVFYPAPGSEIQHNLFPHLDEADENAWALTRSSLFPEAPAGLERRVLRTVFWMIRMANFARSASADGPDDKLRDECGTWRKQIVGRPTSGEAGWKVRSSSALDAGARGMAALAGYLEAGHPCGIRLNRRGRADHEWEYSIYRLAEMIEDRDFYSFHGIPGMSNI